MSTASTTVDPFHEDRKREGVPQLQQPTQRKRHGHHRSKKGTLLCGSFVAGLLFVVVGAIILVIASSSMRSRQEELYAEFMFDARMQFRNIKLEFEQVAGTLRVAASAVEVLPHPVNHTRVYPILASAAGLVDATGHYTLPHRHGPVTVLEHFQAPSMQHAVYDIAEARGVDPDTYTFLAVHESDTKSQTVAPLNFSVADAYIVTHSSHLPPHYSQAELQASGAFLTDFYSDPGNVPMISHALEYNALTARSPFVTPSGSISITVVAPIYYSHWSSSAISSNTNDRGVIVQVVWTTSLLAAVDLDLPIHYSLWDVATSEDEPFIEGGMNKVEGEYAGDHPLEYVSDIEAFSRLYRVRIVPTKSLLDSYADAFAYSWSLYLALGVLLLVSVVAGWLMHVILRRQQVRRSIAQLERDLAVERSLAETESRAHEEVLGYIHHEIRNPLNVIMGTIELIDMALSSSILGEVHKDTKGFLHITKLRPTPKQVSPVMTRRRMGEGRGLNDVSCREMSSVADEDHDEESMARGGSGSGSDGVNGSVEAKPHAAVVETRGQQVMSDAMASGASHGTRVPSPCTLEERKQDTSHHHSDSRLLLKDASMAVALPRRRFHEMREELKLLRSAGVQMEQHVNDMLDLQRLRRHELVLNPLPVDLTAMLQAIISFYQPRSRVPLLLDVHVDTPDVVVIDETRLRQITINSLLNAIAHTSHGSITIRASVVMGSDGKEALHAMRAISRKRQRRQGSDQFLATASGGVHGDGRKLLRAGMSAAASSRDDGSTDSVPQVGALRLSVRDTGVGLKGVSPDSLYHSFVAVKVNADGNAVKQKHQSGLGLSICQLLGESMGGGVNLIDVGNGCEFSCVVPVEVRYDMESDWGSGSSFEASSTAQGTGVCTKPLLVPHEGPVRRDAADETVFNDVSRVGIMKNSDKYHYDAGGGVDDGSSDGNALSLSPVPLPTRPTPSPHSRSVRAIKPQPPPTPSTISVTTSTTPTTATKPMGRRALIVDDDPTNVKLAARMLKLLGVTSQGISTGDIPQEVETALRDGGHMEEPVKDGCSGFDFMLLDIRLGPTLSGVDILKSILPRLRKRVPVYAMTANTRVSDIEEYRDSGFSGLVSKPVSRGKFGKVLLSVKEGLDWFEC